MPLYLGRASEDYWFTLIPKIERLLVFFYEMNIYHLSKILVGNSLLKATSIY